MSAITNTTEGLNLTTYATATRMVLCALADRPDDYRLDGIAQIAFGDMADEPLLFRLLLTMTYEGLLAERHSYYHITDAGFDWLQRYMAGGEPC